MHSVELELGQFYSRDKELSNINNHLAKEFMKDEKTLKSQLFSISKKIDHFKREVKIKKLTDIKESLFSIQNDILKVKQFNANFLISVSQSLSNEKLQEDKQENKVSLSDREKYHKFIKEYGEFGGWEESLHSLFLKCLKNAENWNRLFTLKNDLTKNEIEKHVRWNNERMRLISNIKRTTRCLEKETLIK